MKTLLEICGTQNDIDPRLEQLIESISNRMHAGENVDLEGLVAEHPEFAEALRELVPAVAALVKLGEVSREPTPGEEAAGPPNLECSYQQLGDFRLIREIGRGGMGIVYEAEQLSLRRRVALKVLPFAAVLDGVQLARFRTEAQAAASLHHTNIVQVYSVGCDRSVNYYAMQYVDGRSLLELIAQLRSIRSEVKDKSERSLDTRQSLGHTTIADPSNDAPSNPTSLPIYRSSEYFFEVARLGIQAAEALHHAHTHGVVHRDVKPSNLMVDGMGTLWVTDFGLAQVQCGASLTVTGDLLGTIGYMSPEQASGRTDRIDHRTDIYSLGVTLYELSTLRPAFEGIDRKLLLAKVCEAELRGPRTLERSVPRDLETILLKATQRETADRYLSSQELADDLRRFVENRPIRARRPSFLRIVQKGMRRHRIAVSVAAIAGMIVLALLGNIFWDRVQRIREGTRQVELAMNSAHTAMEADALSLAIQRLTDAEAIIEADQVARPELINEVAHMKREVERYARFLDLLRQAQLTRSGTPAELKPAAEALELYGVMTDESWLKSLEASSLPPSHVERVKDGVYELLLLNAEHLLIWGTDTTDPAVRDFQFKQARRAKEFLDRAESFHEPSRGLYWLYATSEAICGNLSKAAELQKLSLATPAHDAAELFYVNRDRRSRPLTQLRGDASYSFEDNYKGHREMLQDNPSYYNGLFFMAWVLNCEGRHAEALPAWYGCVALLPDDITALVNRGETHLKLGHYDEALADIERALELRSESAVVCASAAWVFATCRMDQYRDGKRAVQLATKACVMSDYKEADNLDVLAAACAEVGNFDAAKRWETKAIQHITFSTAVYDGQKEDFGKRLRSYQMNKPWREGPAKARAATDSTSAPKSHGQD